MMLSRWVAWSRRGTEPAWLDGVRIGCERLVAFSDDAPMARIQQVGWCTYSYLTLLLILPPKSPFPDLSGLFVKPRPHPGTPYPRPTASLGQLEPVGNSLHAYTQTSFVLTRAPETAPFEPPPTVSEASREDSIDLYRPRPRRVSLLPPVSIRDRHLLIWAAVPRVGILTGSTIAVNNKNSARSPLLQVARSLQTSIPRRQPYRR